MHNAVFVFGSILVIATQYYTHSGPI